MSNEISVVANLQVANGGLTYNNKNSFKVDQATKNGPTPGAITVTTGGVTASLAQLTTPGSVIMTNTDATNYVRYGLYIASTFYPFGEIGPLETAIFKLARDILTANTPAAVLRLVANTASCVVKLDVFDK